MSPLLGAKCNVFDESLPASSTETIRLYALDLGVEYVRLQLHYNALVATVRRGD